MLPAEWRYAGEPTAWQLHVRCQRMDAANVLCKQQIERAREGLIDALQKMQEITVVVMMRRICCMKMTPRNVREESKQRCFDGFSLRRGEVSKGAPEFLNRVFEDLAVLAEVFAKLPPGGISDASLIPAGWRPRDFVASCVVPALFGRFWAREQKLEFVQFMVRVCRKLPVGPPDPFALREHWVFECIRAFVMASGVETFLRLSMSEILFNMVIRQRKGGFERLAATVAEIVKRMTHHLASLPTEVRLLARECAKVAPDAAARLARLEVIVIDCLVAPALSHTKVLGTLPATLHIDVMNADGPAGYLGKLLQMFRSLLRPRDVPGRPLAEVERLEQIPFEAFLENLAGVPDVIVGGPSLAEASRLLPGGLPWLFSNFEIACLGRILAQDPHLMGVARQLQMDGQTGVPAYFFVDIAPKAFTGAVALPVVDIAPTGNGLFDSIWRLFIRSRVPTGESYGFAEHIAAIRDSRPGPLVGTLVSLVDHRLGEVPEAELDMVVQRLGEHVEGKSQQLQGMWDLLVRIGQASEALATASGAQVARGEMMQSVVHECLLDIVLDETSRGQVLVRTQVKQMRQQLLHDKGAFNELMEVTVRRIKRACDDRWAEGVAAQFHTWLAQELPLEMFRDARPDLKAADDRLVGIPAQVIRMLCVEPAPAKEKEIFANRDLFEFCKIELLDSEFVSLPMEAMAHLKAAIDLIIAMFQLAHGGALPAADEMTPLLNYALLSSGMSRMVSLQKYLEHFLVGTTVLDEQQSVALTHFINHVSMLTDMVSGLPPQ